MEMKVTQLHYNWRQVSDSKASGEDYDTFIVGQEGVVEIIEDEPRNGNQVWNYLVVFDDGKFARVFNPNLVLYSKSEETK